MRAFCQPSALSHSTRSNLRFSRVNRSNTDDKQKALRAHLYVASQRVPLIIPTAYTVNSICRRVSYCMAIYHLHVSIISRKTGRSSVGASAYRAGEKLHNDYDGVTHDYTNRNAVSSSAYRSGERLTNERGEVHNFTNKRGVVYSEIMLPENAPQEFKDRQTLWNAVEKSEKRCDAQTARDIDVAFPVEVNRREQINIMREYIQENFVDKGMIADFAIHDKGDGNPHAHIMLTTRNVNNRGFGNKNRDWNSKEYLQSWRENWAEICNDKLQQKGLSERIDHRTLEAQGIDREPTIHIGVKAKSMERKGRESDRINEYKKIVSRNENKNVNKKPENIAEYMHDLKQGLFILEKDITSLEQEINEAQREITSLNFTAEKITERAEHIQSIDKKIEVLREQRQNMGIFTSKKAVDEQIGRLENSRLLSANYFKREFSFVPEQAGAEVERLQNRARSKGHLIEKLQIKLTPLLEEQNIFALEYQREDIFTELNPQGQKIQNELQKLDNIFIQKLSPYENLIFRQSQSMLENITEQNFDEILKDMLPEQVNKFMNIQEEKLFLMNYQQRLRPHYEREREHILYR